MTRVLYNPGSDMPQKTSIFGYDFDGSRNGEPTEVTDVRALSKLRAMQPDKGEGEPGTAEFVPWFQVMDDEPATSHDGLHAVHRGRGKYSVMDGDEEVVSGLDKASRDAFNALSDEDKAAYVEANKEPASP